MQRTRKKFGTKRRSGGFLPYFLIYDLLAAAYVVWRYGLIISVNAYSPSDEATAWKFWTTVFFAKQQYALMAFPFLIFSVPVLGKALTKAKRTGYDMRGVLCATLSSSQIKQVYLRRKKAKEQMNLKSIGASSSTPAQALV